jgi:hypothetical protein
MRLFIEVLTNVPHLDSGPCNGRCKTISSIRARLALVKRAAVTRRGLHERPAIAPADDVRAARH